MKLPLILLSLLAALPGCQSAQYEVQTLGAPLGTVVPAQDWAADIEIDNKRITGDSKGGTILLWNTGDEKYAAGVVGETAFIGLMPPITTARLRELKAAAVYDAVKKSGCEVLAYPVFWWEEERIPFLYTTYTVHVKGNPGWLRGFQPIPRENRAGINYLPNAKREVAAQPRGKGQSSRATIRIDAASTESGRQAAGTEWNNWDEPWGSTGGQK